MFCYFSVECDQKPMVLLLVCNGAIMTKVEHTRGGTVQRSWDIKYKRAALHCASTGTFCFWPLQANQLLRKNCLRICLISFFDISEAPGFFFAGHLSTLMREGRRGVTHTSNSLQGSIIRHLRGRKRAYMALSVLLR